MPEIREDPLTDTCVIFAANRDDRPYEFEKAVPRRMRTVCPFCPGNEEETPPELARYEDGKSNGVTGWSVRVVPNKYPAVGTADNGISSNPSTSEASPAYGRHEVIVESAQHKTCFNELTRHEARLACLAYRDRLQVARDTDGIKFAHVFKNRGPAAGASLEHVHTQLIALPAVPARVSQFFENSRRLIEQQKGFLTEWLDRGLEPDARTVERTEHLVAYCPYAARFPYETRIAPLEGASDFLNAKLELVHELADLLQRSIRRIELVSGHAAYNFSLNLPPFDENPAQHFAWQVEIFPRLSTPAGFEWATGWFINPMMPEDSASILRDARIGDMSGGPSNISSRNGS